MELKLQIVNSVKHKISSFSILTNNSPILDNSKCKIIQKIFLHYNMDIWETLCLVINLTKETNFKVKFKEDFRAMFQPYTTISI